MAPTTSSSSQPTRRSARLLNNALKKSANASSSSSSSSHPPPSKSTTIPPSSSTTPPRKRPTWNTRPSLKRTIQPTAASGSHTKKRKINHTKPRGQRRVTPSPTSCRRGIRSVIEHEAVSAGLPPGVINIDGLYSSCGSHGLSSGCCVHGAIATQSSASSSRRSCLGMALYLDGNAPFLGAYGCEYYGHLFEAEKELVLDCGWNRNRRKQRNGKVAEVKKRKKKKESLEEDVPKYMSKQKHLSVSMRVILIDWLIELKHEYKLNSKTLHLAVRLVDRTLECLVVKRTELQCVGCACMLIACKLEEINPPLTDDFVYVSDSTYNRKQIIKMEIEIATALSFRLQLITPYHFLHRFLQANGVSSGLPILVSNPYFDVMVEYLSELSFLQYQFVDKKPSLIMASVVYLARATLGLRDERDRIWTCTLEFYTGYDKTELEDTVRKLHCAQANIETSEYKCVFEMYKRTEFLEVAFKPVLLEDDLGF